MTDKIYRLNFQLVPDGCWYTNLRSALPKEVWDKLRRAAYARAGGRCMICGAGGRLEAHEVWSYDDEKHIQKLEDIVAEQVKAISNLKIDKVTVWDNGDNKDGTTSTANFLSGMLKSLPPLEEVYNMAGLSLPKIVAPQKAEDESAEGKNEEKTEAEPKKNK